MKKRRIAEPPTPAPNEAVVQIKRAAARTIRFRGCVMGMQFNEATGQVIASAALDAGNVAVTGTLRYSVDPSIVRIGDVITGAVLLEGLA